MARKAMIEKNNKRKQLGLKFNKYRKELIKNGIKKKKSYSKLTKNIVMHKYSVSFLALFSFPFFPTHLDFVVRRRRDSHYL